MFFNKSLKLVTYDDVQYFCSTKIKENQALEYKKDFPNHLDKIIASFANTYGGLIIIGIPEADGVPIDNPEGIIFERGLEEKVNNIILSNITPAVFPEIQVCPPKNNKTFILILVPQSSNTPHSVENNTKVYLRTGNISQPEKLVNLDELHWLSRNRERAVYLRNDLINSALGRYYNLCQINKVQMEFAEMNMLCVPLYPNGANGLIEKILDTNNVYLVKSRTGGIVFPSITKSSFQTAQDSIYLFSNEKNSWGEFTEYTNIDRYGLLVQNIDLGNIKKLDSGLNQKQIYLTRVINQFVSMIKFYKNILPLLNVLGDFKIRVFLVKMLGIYSIPAGLTIFEEPKQFNDKIYHYETNINLTNFSNTEFRKLAFDFIQDLHWSFNWRLSEERINNWIDKEIGYFFK